MIVFLTKYFKIPWIAHGHPWQPTADPRGSVDHSLKTPHLQDASTKTYQYADDTTRYGIIIYVRVTILSQSKKTTLFRILVSRQKQSRVY